MLMTEAFASAVAVIVPIFALAAGAEARGIRERLRQPDPQWEREFATYSAEHDLDMTEGPGEIISYLKGVPIMSTLHKVERGMAIGGAITWLVVFLMLGITELNCLIWLAGGAAAGDPGLAQFSVVSIGLAMLTLILAPLVYLVMPLALPLDLIPKSLKEAVAPKLDTPRGRGFVRQVLTELEGALDRASETYAEQKPADPAGQEVPQEPGQ
jgi:hypothetical protein